MTKMGILPLINVSSMKIISKIIFIELTLNNCMALSYIVNHCFCYIGFR